MKRQNWMVAVCALAVGGCMSVASSDNDLGQTDEEIRGGSVPPLSSFEAVGVINCMAAGDPHCGGCTATLINNYTALTAAHCVCTDAENNPVGDVGVCGDVSQFVLRNVVTTSSGGLRVASANVLADIVVDPEFHQNGWLSDDYAILKLRTPADGTFVVNPIHVTNTAPTVGETETLVGYGNFGAGCSSANNGSKHAGSTAVDSVSTTDLVYTDSTIGICDGDSGGPALNPTGSVVGVGHTSDGGSTSDYAAIRNAWTWLTENACHIEPESGYDSNYCADPVCQCTAGEGTCTTSAQCVVGNECVPGIGVEAGKTTADGLCWTSSWLARVYADNNQSGASYELPAGKWDFDVLHVYIGNDAISSLAVPDGLTVKLWAEAGCSGSDGVYNGTINNVGSMDNNTSCLEVIPSATLYANTSYGGTKQTFVPGGYNVNGLTTIGNDNAESLVAPPGVLVRLCSESGTPPSTVGWGTCNYFQGRVTTLGTLNNTVSNIEVFMGATLYSSADYGGNKQTVLNGVSHSTDLTTVGDNAMSSIIVSPGMQARLCTNSDGTGTCRNFTGWNAYIGDDLNDQVSYVSLTTVTAFP